MRAPLSLPVIRRYIDRMIKGVVVQCSGCGATLRHGKLPGALCDPCERNGPDIARALSPAFYVQSVVQVPSPLTTSVLSFGWCGSTPAGPSRGWVI